MKILFATSEAHPLIKTGGLADVSGSLPRALRNTKQDIRLVLPAYPAAKAAASAHKAIINFTPAGASSPVTLLQGRLPKTRVPVYLVDAPDYFDRPGGPYSQPDGKDWPDNDQRFAQFCRAVCAIALDQAGLDWQPDLVHCNDWQTGLVPALLSLHSPRPASLFTIHNLAYQGLFSQAQFQALELPPQWWSMQGLEFYDQFSFIKGGLVFADWLTTVSPTYAREICTPAYGNGLDGLLTTRANVLTGILNGVDYQVWNPGRDTLIPQTYTSRTLKQKQINKAALQEAFGLPVEPSIPLCGHVGRLVEQKGIDLIIELYPALLDRNVQLVMLGTGQPEYESALRKLARQYPQQVQAHIGYDEKLSHLVEAGADLFLMPSRFEPCGLNQLYSLRYGTPPVVRHTGGLADSVVDATPEQLAQQTATGFVFAEARVEDLLGSINRALDLYEQPAQWRQIVRTGMQQDFSWTRSAAAYLEVYKAAISRNPRGT